jgi:hypothetical protein
LWAAHKAITRYARCTALVRFSIRCTTWHIIPVVPDDTFLRQSTRLEQAGTGTAGLLACCGTQQPPQDEFAQCGSDRSEQVCRIIRRAQCSALACAGSARPLGTGTARPVLDPLLKKRLPLLATLAAARGSMALALMSVYEHYIYYYYPSGNVWLPSSLVPQRQQDTLPIRLLTLGISMHPARIPGPDGPDGPDGAPRVSLFLFFLQTTIHGRSPGIAATIENYTNYRDCVAALP